MRRSTISAACTLGLVVLFAVSALATSAASPAVGSSPGPIRDATDHGTLKAVAVPSSWTFAIYDFQDPFTGGIQQPAIPGTRTAAAEIELINHSKQSLTLYLNNMRLHTDKDLTYPSGLIIGVPDDEGRLTPKLVEGVVEAGSTARGWVWWRVPEAEKPVEVDFFPSPPPPSIIPLPVSPRAAAPTAGATGVNPTFTVAIIGTLALLAAVIWAVFRRRQHTAP